MGIKNLDRFLKENNIFTKKRHLSLLSGKRIAIDAQGLLYRYVYGSVKQHSLHYMTFEDRNIYIDTVIQKYITFDKQLKKHGITPIFVFDGKAPKEKFETQQKRRNVKEENKKNAKENKSIQTVERDIRIESSEIKQIIFALQEKGITVDVDPTREAECYCAKMCKEGKVDIVYSIDSDLVCYLCPLIIKSIEKEEVEILALSTILRKLEFTEEELVIFCILCGCDYNKNPWGVGCKKVYELVKENGDDIKKIEKKVNKIRYKGKDSDFSVVNYQRTRDLFRCENDEIYK